MHETAEDMKRLRRMLDESYAKAGKHLLSIHTPDWRLSAEQVVEELKGMCVLTLATVNARSEPMLGPVDGMFYRGRFHCGSARNSIRSRHISSRPAVSAGHVRGEELAVIVHGTAEEVDLGAEEGFRNYVGEVYGEPMTDWEGDESLGTSSTGSGGGQDWTRLRLSTARPTRRALLH